MATAHYTRDYVWLAVTDDSFNIPYAALTALGINGIFRHAGDTLAKFNADRSAGFKTGIFYPASSQYQDGAVVAKLVSDDLTRLALNDGGQTPVLLDFEPSYGSAPFWRDFLWGKIDVGTGAAIRGWRGTGGLDNGGGYRPGRVTDFTPEPFQAVNLPCADLAAGRLDARVQYYFGDMSPVDGGEAREDLEIGLNGVGFAREAVRGFVDGGRTIKPPIFYKGNRVRSLEPGTNIWNANLMREAGLI